MTLQGFPPAMTSGGIFFITTEPAAIILLSPIVTPFRIIQFVPINTSFPILTGEVFPLERYSGILLLFHSIGWKSVSIMRVLRQSLYSSQ